MRKILDFKSFKLNEGANQAEVQNLQMQRAQAVKDMQAAQAKIADIDMKLAQAQMSAVANAQKVTAPTQATAPVVPATSPVAEGLGIDADGNLGEHTLHILDYGFDDGTFWIGFSENFEDDKIIPEDEFLDYVDQWAHENFGEGDIAGFYGTEEDDYTGEDDWGGGPMGKYFDPKSFFEEQGRDVQKEIIEDYLKSQ